MALMGEAGPEAVLPLRRGRGGRLGVETSGGGVGSVVVNVDATGSTVQGDDAKAGQLGNSIAAAIQFELIKQQRPGGLLAR
jgi:phage-related minor tail protein